MPSITPTSDAHWRELRSKNIGASESAALFGLSPWTTPWQLYHIKKGNLPDGAEASHMTAGRHFEPAIASLAAETLGIPLRKVHRYITDDVVEGMGASLDYETATGERMPAEVKLSLFGDGWSWEGDTLTEAPEYYIMQCQHQMAVTGAQKALLIAWAGFKVRSMLIPRSDTIIAAIREKVAEFWTMVRENREPDPDFTADGDPLAKLAMALKYKAIEIADPDFAFLCEEQKRLAAAAKTAEEEADAMKARILHRIMAEAQAEDGDMGKVVVRAPGYKISLTRIADSAGKVVTEDMVGTMIGARKGHLRTTITPTEEK